MILSSVQFTNTGIHIQIQTQIQIQIQILIQIQIQEGRRPPRSCLSQQHPDPAVQQEIQLEKMEKRNVDIRYLNIGELNQLLLSKFENTFLFFSFLIY